MFKKSKNGSANQRSAQSTPSLNPAASLSTNAINPTNPKVFFAPEPTASPSANVKTYMFSKTISKMKPILIKNLKKKNEKKNNPFSKTKTNLFHWYEQLNWLQKDYLHWLTLRKLDFHCDSRQQPTMLNFQEKTRFRFRQCVVQDHNDVWEFRLKHDKEKVFQNN